MTANDLPFAAWAKELQDRMELVLGNQLPTAQHIPARLHESMRYATLGGGKRVRPLLTFAAAELVNGQPDTVGIVAASLEMIHAYSLVHDDLPAMDNDVLRRGKPTCHIAFDEATALLAGDALQTQAFILLTRLPLSAAQSIMQVKLLAEASGSAGMAGGQAIDLASVGKPLTLPELEQMHIMKTGALIRAAVRMGAHCEPDAQSALDEHAHAQLDKYAQKIGLAFQVVDDILDVEADSTTLGKTAGKDAAADKPTYVSLMGLSDAKKMARELHAEAHDALVGFGDKARRLKELADYIVLRTY
ncbi:polyprenyl synthetase family protein [Leeia oryzae]|uniref:polyprenyl synthetase family protein n=1 Tax=Leeia oryzae TaxID=356662 RepID=UPI00036106CB|nr:farnesyl diphosphate synthase [Leeia oryzae]